METLQDKMLAAIENSKVETTYESEWIMLVEEDEAAKTCTIIALQEQLNLIAEMDVSYKAASVNKQGVFQRYKTIIEEQLKALQGD